MLAEQELNSIFSKHKGFSSSSASSVGASMRYHNNASSNCLNTDAATQLGNSFSTNASSSKTDNSVSARAGYNSIFNRLEAPLKRPSCNPFIKNESIN